MDIKSTLKKLSPAVPKRVLLIEAALLWGFAGTKILSISYRVLVDNAMNPWIDMLIGIIGFYFFFKLVFLKMYRKHTKRIMNYQATKMCIFSFFDIKGFIIMAFMISFGIALKSLQFVPMVYLGTFYVSLGLSLFTAAICFLYSGLVFRHV